MNRSEFVRNTCKWLSAVAAGLFLSKTSRATEGASSAIEPAAVDEALRKQLQQEKGTNQFVNNWLTDLFDTIDQTLDEPTRIKLLEGCGRGCFNRHEFKREIARKGSGDLEKLIEAYKRNFEIWREGDEFVHIRYGERSPGCYCPAARNRPARPNDVHCECTRMTHQTIFETALGRRFKVDVLQSIRRGGQTCHFRVHLAPVESAS